MTLPRPVTLIILDGFGYKAATRYNAIQQAHTPHLDQYFATYPHTLLAAAGAAVGLPAGQMGNSEVGHLTLGAGRYVPQDLTRIDAAIADGSFFDHPTLTQLFEDTKKSTGALHVLGLVSDGGVHSHLHHILALLSCAQQHGLTHERIFVHAFLDGRDTPPQSAGPYLEKIQQQGCATLASLCGRYYAMDRDQRWERVEQAYDLLTLGLGATLPNADLTPAEIEHYLATAYARGETDEFIRPMSVLATPATINAGDNVIFMNFRSDRARELTDALINPAFNGFQRKKVAKIRQLVSLTEYQAEFNALSVRAAYPPVNLEHTLGQYLSALGKTQLRLAETEKYAHVTFFFNGGVETPFPGEARLLIPSPRVATYDLQPEMSAPALTEQLVRAITAQAHDVIICNYANPDMVGHTGNFHATIQAIEALDACLDAVVTATQTIGGELLITADHGNAECMFDDTTQQPHTAHTTEQVPLLYIGRPARIRDVPDATLADVAPTLLYLLGITPPPEMTGRILLQLE